MKRHGFLYHKIYDINNLYLADQIASKGKSKQRGIINHLVNQDQNIHELYLMLRDKNYRTSDYTTFKIYEPKERTIFRLPYYPDRIVHHAIMNVLEPIFVSTFTADTYSCIKGRGIHSALYKLKRALVDVDGTKYCLKLDIQKFYPSIDHNVLKSLLKRKFKDPDLLNLLFEIIDSADGLPIGNYLSQYLANFYLTGFDHWLKENFDVDYFRYSDDMIILCNNKKQLHFILSEIRKYLGEKLLLTVKKNYQIFPVDARGINMLGYIAYHPYTLLRKPIKKNFARAVSKSKPQASIAAYMGWAKHCNSRHLIKKLLPDKCNQKHSQNLTLKRQSRHSQAIRSGLTKF